MQCNEAELIIIENEVERLSRLDRKRFEGHLETCSKCRGFLEMTTGFMSVLNPLHTTEILPGVDIIKKYIFQTNRFYPRQHSLIVQFGQRLWRVLDYRIPIYQGVIVVLVAALIIFGISSLPFTKTHPPEQVENISPAMFDFTISFTF